MAKNLPAGPSSIFLNGQQWKEFLHFLRPRLGSGYVKDSSIHSLKTDPIQSPSKSTHNLLRSTDSNSFPLPVPKKITFQVAQFVGSLISCRTESGSSWSVELWNAQMGRRVPRTRRRSWCRRRGCCCRCSCRASTRRCSSCTRCTTTNRTACTGTGCKSGTARPTRRWWTFSASTSTNFTSTPTAAVTSLVTVVQRVSLQRWTPRTFSRCLHGSWLE